MRLKKTSMNTERGAAQTEITLEDQLKAIVIGQDEAIDTIAPFIRISQAGIAPPRRPAGVFMLAGPTGVGKTRLAEAIAQVLHGDAGMMLRVDCAEYQGAHETSRLIGAPPGYLGHRETPPLLSPIGIRRLQSEKSKLSVILLDELEKAHDTFFQLLLGILDSGMLRLGDNTQSDFQQTLILMTTNLGGRDIQKAFRPEFGYAEMVPAAPTAGTSANITATAARRRFSAEFLNRLDVILTFNELSASSLERVTDLEIEALHNMLGLRLDEPVKMQFSQGARSWMVSHCRPEYGARELKRTLHRSIMSQIAKLILDNKDKVAEWNFKINLVNNKLVVSI